MKAIEVLKANRFSVETTKGSFYAQQSDVEFFSTKEQAEKFYNESTISESEMENASWSNDGQQPDFTIELRELQSIPVDMVEELEEDAEEMECEISDIYITYSVRIKTKCYLFNKQSVALDCDSDEEKAERKQMQRWQLVERDGSTYSTLTYSKDVVSLIDGSNSTMKGAIQ